MIDGFRIKSPSGWLWNDDELCASSLLPSDEPTINRGTTNASAFNFYMPGAEPKCPEVETCLPDKLKCAACGRCGFEPIEVPDFRRAAAMEVVFFLDHITPCSDRSGTASASCIWGRHLAAA
jgi:hypothetical protein